MQTYIFVIDTDSYAGNFSKELVAYCTGLGESYSCLEKVAQFQKDMNTTQNLFEVIYEIYDETCCLSWSKLYSTPGYFNNGISNFKNGEEEAAHEHYRQWCLRETQELDSEQWLNRADQPLKKYPAYQSIAMYMSRIPTSEEIRIITERAKKFSDDINILGFRLLLEETTQKEIAQYD